MTRSRHRGIITSLTMGAVLAATLAGTTSAQHASQAPDPTDAWPRTIVHEAGETVIPAQPHRIASTTLSVGGTLLAIGAPVTHIAATNPGGGTADDRGFLVQWADVATERGVEVLYPNLEFDLEAVIAAEPDLIIASTSGADAQADQYEALSAIAPTIVVNYGNKSWQDLAIQLGEATGLEDQAAAAIADFDGKVAAAAAAITVPEGGVSIVGYNGAAYDSAVSKAGSAQAALLTTLGFTVLPPPDGLDTSTQVRQDFAFVSMENLTQAIQGATVLLISVEDDVAAEFLAEPVLANLPAVVAGRVHALGYDSFRIDYYSGLDVVERIVALFGS